MTDPIHSSRQPRALTLREVAECVGAEVPSGILTKPITQGASLQEAEPGDVVFFEHPKYLKALRSTRAEVALVPKDFNEEVPPILIRVDRPSLSFTKLLEKLAPQEKVYTPGIHPTAVIEPGAQVDPSATVQAHAMIEAGARIGARTLIGAHSVIGADCQIGEDCLIYPHAVLRDRTVVGSRVIIHSGAVLGSDGFGFQFVNGEHVKVPHIGIVQIEDDVEIGAGSTIDRARFGKTLVGKGTKIDNLVHLGHNVVVGPHCLIVAQTGVSGSSRLGKYVTLAGQSGIAGHVEIGEGAVVYAKSGVSRDVPPKEHLLGMIGVPVKEAREILAHYHRLPKTVARLKQLETEVQELKEAMKKTGAAKTNPPGE